MSLSTLSVLTSMWGLMGVCVCVSWGAGRAAQRLQEVFSDQDDSGMSSSTIHRLLGYRNNEVQKRTAAAAAAGAASGSSLASVADLTLDDDVVQDLDLGSSCEFNRNNPLPVGNYLVDEVSMMDTPLTAALFSALRCGQCLAGLSVDEAYCQLPRPPCTAHTWKHTPDAATDVACLYPTAQRSVFHWPVIVRE